MGHLRGLVGFFLKDNSDWLVRFAQGAMLAAGILATYALATKIMEIGTAVQGLTAVDDQIREIVSGPGCFRASRGVTSGARVCRARSTIRRAPGNLQLAQLDTVDARTLQDKVALENAKTAIEVQAMKDRTKIELEEIDARKERQAPSF